MTAKGKTRFFFPQPSQTKVEIRGRAFIMISKQFDTSQEGLGEPVFAWLQAGGEMGALMRTLDWSNTKLGRIDKWPQSLRTTVSTCLNSRFAILVWWGPDLVMLYNDAYREILASKHPEALGNPGRECWAEIWDTIGPMLQSVMQDGAATWSYDLFLLVERHGYAEECYFTFSYSPVSDESGGIGGVFTPVMETTDRVIAERRSATLRELAGSSTAATSEGVMWELASEVLGRNPYDLSCCVLYALDPSCKHIEAKSFCGIPASHPLCQARIDTANLNSPLLRAVGDSLRTGKMVLLPESGESSLELPAGAWTIVPAEAIALPITLPGQSMPSACLLAGLNAHKRFGRDYQLFLEALSRQLASNLAAARAREEEMKRTAMLAELDRAKTRFFSNVSHEFRTPITLMLGPLEDTLANARGLDQEHRNDLQIAHRNSLRLLKLVNALLDFSRIEAGRIQARYEPTDLCGLTAELASQFHSAIERAGLKLIINCPASPELAYVDHEMWEKIVFNLLSNAFKFTFKGEIEVSLLKVRDTLELRVRDTGTGIPAKDLPHLFERFYRVEEAHGRTWEGSGIGLGLVQELIKLHGGTVRVESELFQGSTFIVTIPLGKDHLPTERIGARSHASTGINAETYVQEALYWSASAQEVSDKVETAFFVPTKAAALSPEKKSQPVGRVLFADDNADMRRYLEKLLNPRYEVVPCEDGQVALERARQMRPDLVLADVMMPRMDGFGLLRELREDKDLRDVPVILLSARAGEESRIEGLDAGADDYLVKPFSARELMARVGSHLTMAKIRREVAELKVRNVEMSDEIKTLRGTLLICSYCKKIETNPETWMEVENYVRKHSEAEFNHGVCPDCLRKEMLRLA